MPVNGLNIGKDVTLDITTPNGVLRPSIRTNFNSKQVTHSLTSNAADGTNRFAELPAGWEGSFDFDRADSTLDDYVAQTEAQYFAGVAQVPMTITETIQEVSGAVTQYRYTGVVIKYDDAGDKKGNEFIKLKVSFKAARRIKVA